MRECFVSFASAAEVMEFVTIATKQTVPIQVEYSTMQPSATSIMSIFSMGFHRPLRVIGGDAGAEAARVLDQVRPYLVAC